VAFALALASAAVVVYAIWVVLMSLAFWFVSSENIAVLFDAVYEGRATPSRRTRERCGSCSCT